MAAELAAEMGDVETARREVTRGAVLFSRHQCAVAEGRVGRAGGAGGPLSSC